MPPSPDPEDNGSLAGLIRNEQTKRRRRTILSWSAGVVVLGLIAAGAWLWWPRPPGLHERFHLAELSRGPILRRVSATGRLEASSTVTVGAQISGRIAEVLVDYDDRVEADQLLARFESAQFAAQLEQARARTAAAQAEDRRAEVTLANARRERERARTLLSRGVLGQADLDAAQLQVDLANVAHQAAHAQVRLQEATQRLAEIDMAHTEIRAPQGGIVISRAVEPGQTVAAAFQAPVLFEIAADLTQMRVMTPIDEADVAAVQPGQTATFTVDAYPGRSFVAKVIELRSAPQLVNNVVSYDAVIEVGNGDLALMPGMTASVEVETASTEDALRAPNSALRFRPPNTPATSGATLWQLGAQGPVAVSVQTGISDGVLTQIEGPLGEGDEVIVELTDAGRKTYGEH